jgi:hypothetical protein
MIENAKVKVFPNPSSGSFTLDMNQISFSSPIIDLKVYNVIGELVHQSTEEVNNLGTTKEIDLKGLANGAYYLRLNAGNKAYSVKLIIAK